MSLPNVWNRVQESQDRWTTAISTVLLSAALGICAASARGDFFVGNDRDQNVLRFDDAGNFINVFHASTSNDDGFGY